MIGCRRMCAAQARLALPRHHWVGRVVACASSLLGVDMPPLLHPHRAVLPVPTERFHLEQRRATTTWGVIIRITAQWCTQPDAAPFGIRPTVAVPRSATPLHRPPPHRHRPRRAPLTLLGCALSGCTYQPLIDLDSIRCRVDCETLVRRGLVAVATNAPPGRTGQMPIKQCEWFNQNSSNRACIDIKT